MSAPHPSASRLPWPPSSLKDAEERRESLIAEVMAVQTHLTNKKLGRQRLSGEEFKAHQTWRSKAIDALTIKTAALRKVKLWIRDNSPRGEARESASRAALAATRDLLFRAWAVLSDIDDLSAEETALEEEIRAHLGVP